MGSRQIKETAEKHRERRRQRIPVGIQADKRKLLENTGKERKPGNKRGKVPGDPERSGSRSIKGTKRSELRKLSLAPG